MKPLPGLSDFLDGSIRTLGFGVLNWCSEYLGQPDGDNQGGTWTFTTEQALFILRWYAVDDRGRFIFKHAILERPKGWGKSPLVAAMCCVELLGPVRFSHFDDNGKPMGKPVGTPLVQVVAHSESQVNNTYDLIMLFLQQGPAYYAYELEDAIMLSKVQLRNGGKIEKVTSSPSGREGQRVSFVVCDETHLWVPAVKGPELMDALKRNAAKRGQRVIETTNAFLPGQGSAAEISYDAAETMVERLEAAGIDTWPNTLFDSRQVYVKDIYDPATAIPALNYVYGDSALDNGGFVDIVGDIFPYVTDPSQREHVARRFFFNQHIHGHSTWLNLTEWEACRDNSIKLKKSDVIALGFKTVPRHGAAVIVAYRLKDGALFNLSGPHWERLPEDPREWEIPVPLVDKRMRKILDDYYVWKVLADQQSFQDIIGRWSVDYEDMFLETSVSNKTKMARFVEQFEEAVLGRRIKWNDEQIDRHVRNCHEELVPSGRVIRKETKGSANYIVGAQAAILALEAGCISIEEGALKKKAGTLTSY